MDIDTPRVEACIDAMMKKYPGATLTYYREVHQELGPLARALEREVAQLRREAEAASIIAAVTDQEIRALRARVIAAKADNRDHRDALPEHTATARSNAK